jgi:hypothetical protein
MRAFLLYLMLFVLVLTGCGGQPSRPRSAPAMPVEQPAATLVEKVVEMVTATPPPTVVYTMTDETESSPTAEPPASFGPTLAEQGVETATYRDEYAGFAIDYPAGWEAIIPDDAIKEQSQAYSISLRMLLPGTPEPKRQEGPLAPGEYAVDVTIIRRPGAVLDLSAQERREQNLAEGNVDILSEDFLNTYSGLPAVRWNMHSQIMGPVVTTLAVIDGYEILVSGFGDLSFYNAVAGSLRLIE